MNSLPPGALERQPIPARLLTLARELGEARARAEVLKREAASVLGPLHHAALLESMESSCRLDGVVVPGDRLRKLAGRKTIPRTRAEAELAGYRDVLQRVHAEAARLEPGPALVLELHRQLYRFAPRRGGRWKALDLDPARPVAAETRPGTRARFRPVRAYFTPIAMERLHERLHAHWRAGSVDPLLLVPAYTLDFLCIQPFPEGNGRMARLLAVLLLLRAGYDAVRFISLERIFEQTDARWVEAFQLAADGWHDNTNVLAPWWEYFLGDVLLRTYQELEQRATRAADTRSARRDLVFAAVERMRAEFRYRDLVRACPAVSRPTIHRALRELRTQGRIRCLERGRDARWAKQM